MENSLEPSIYRPLDKSKQEIRLIEIVAIQPEIICRLSVVSLLDNPEFFALSYVWGDARNTYNITVNNRKVSATANLAMALVGSWLQFQPNGAANESALPKRLWADAICINQHDVLERNHQVTFMRNIYSSARRVYSWVGDETQELGQAMDTLITVCRELVALGPSGPTVANAVQWMQKYPELCSYKPNSGVKFTIWTSVTQFFLESYWYRVWIFQEIVLAKDLVLLCGTRAISGVFLEVLLFWIDFVQATHTMEAKPAFIATPVWGMLLQQGFLVTGILRRIEAAKKLQVIRQSNMYPQLDLHLGISLVKQASDFQATDPKDYVYALSSLVGLDISPDYSTRTTVADVYCELVSVWLKYLYYNPSPNLPETAPETDLWFLSIAGCGYGWKEVPGLPSWAPNFCWTGRGGTPAAIPAGSLPSIPHAFLGCKARPRLLHPSLFCEGIRLDHFEALPPIATRVEEVLLWILEWPKTTTQYLSGSQFLAEVLLLLKDLKPGVRFAEAKERPYDGLFPLLHALWVNFLVSRGRALVDAQGKDRALFHEFRNKLNLTGEPWADLEGKLVYAAPAALEFGMNYILPLITLGHRIGLTRKGFLGGFPPNLLVGDELFILKGFDAPVVLRKERNYYRHVGTCRIPGIVDVNGKVHGTEPIIESVHIR